jgi:hypothetical protein
VLHSTTPWFGNRQIGRTKHAPSLHYWKYTVRENKTTKEVHFLHIYSGFSSPEKGEKYTIARFSFIWQIVSNRWLIRFKTFVS